LPGAIEASARAGTREEEDRRMTEDSGAITMIVPDVEGVGGDQLETGNDSYRFKHSTTQSRKAPGPGKSSWT